VEVQTGSWKEFIAHTPLVQSENQSGEWSEFHGKRRFSWGEINKNLGKTT
jgi:hypothetical protein